MTLAIAYIPCASENQAQKIAWHLLSKKVIACANIFPISSIYSWKGKVMNAKEFVLLAKTSESKFEELKSEVKLVHSYQVPCIIKISADVNKEYGDWVHSQIGLELATPAPKKVSKRVSHYTPKSRIVSKKSKKKR